MRALTCLLPLLLAACDQNMVQQSRYDVYEETELFPHDMVMQPPPEGTVARDAPQRLAAAERPPVTRALLERGRERFEIYCSVCHGADGRGHGPVVERGFPQPPSYLEPRLVAAPASHFYQVITDGYGVMYSYADRVPPQDRWAIASHIRVLQAARSAADDR